jgi:pyruvate,water dikinase
MRWEELWDAALRIRSAYLRAKLPASVQTVLTKIATQFGAGRQIIVRSSAPGEDSGGRSFAGLHESIVATADIDSLTDALRRVWASLWSDAALLYRNELGLDPRHSSMSVLIQAFRAFSPSGITFGRDPRDTTRDIAIVEAVPGPCSDLVDGLVDPDRWHVALSTRTITDYRPGGRDDGAPKPLLDDLDVSRLIESVADVETLFGWYPDVEWTGRKDDLTFVQARPITTGDRESADDERQWYLSLRPGSRKLALLCERVTDELIPELQAEGERLAAVAIDKLADPELAAEIRNRLAAVKRWKQIYADEFIPFAHGVRQLGTYYNDAVKPDDPYEFIGLLRGEAMLASQRNQTLSRLAQLAADDQRLHAILTTLRKSPAENAAEDWQHARTSIEECANGPEFLREFDDLIAGYMDVSYKADRFNEHPEVFLHAILEQASGLSEGTLPVTRLPAEDTAAKALEQKLLDAISVERHGEAQEVIRIARISWRLRDDDNLLIGRLESQLLRAVSAAAGRLRAAGHLEKAERLNDKVAVILADALIDPPDSPIFVDYRTGQTGHEIQRRHDGKPRQLVGQPGSPGLATGQACIVRDRRDLTRFKAGNVLVCDAIQPTMTHVVPLACAIVERRGGMLIHGAIIARELGIPCVNGVASAVELITDGEILAVDGHLGIVTVGPPEFDAELGTAIARDSGRSEVRC